MKLSEPDVIYLEILATCAVIAMGVVDQRSVNALLTIAWKL